MTTTVLLTGGCGFIGSNFSHALARARPGWRLVVLDKLTYSGNAENLEGLDHELVRGDVADAADVARAFDACEGDVRLVHMAAETHVDRSIEDGLPFLRTNVVGTQVLLDAARERGVKLFLHVSTDEVYGPLPAGTFAGEEARLAPRNAYSASKAASDHLVLAAHNTFGLPVVVTRCSNNFGPWQFPEKFVPLMIANARESKPLPVYGDGLYERDWLAVEDHCEALLAALDRGRPGAIYNVAGGNHRTNLEVVKLILEELGRPASLIRHVQDRPGHDRRYAPDAKKIARELGWKPKRPFAEALRATIRWYGEHADWLARVRSGEYRGWYERQYGERLET